MTTPPLICCVCGRTEARPWRVGRDNLLGGEETFHAVRCVHCGTRRLDPRPPAETMGRFYAPDTYARAEEPGSEVGKRLDSYNEGLAARITARFSAPGAVLDVGCGDGRFLQAMAAREWAVTGTEADPVAASLARRRTNATIHEAAALESPDLPEAGFTVVSLLHVLEHVPDPRETLAACFRLLRPGGALLLALPNAASAEAAIFGSAWYHLDLPRHLWGFTPRSLVRLVEESGFAVASLQHFPLLFAPQSALTALRRRRRRQREKSAATNGDGGGGSGGGRLQTRVFLSLLAVSERLGRTLPGEIMEMVAVRPAGNAKQVL